MELSLEEAYNGVERRFSLAEDGQTRTFDVRIPAGIGDGSRVRVSGKGEQGAGGGKSGDLYLRIKLLPHPVFERKGRDLDLHMTVTVPVTTAVLGGEAEIQTISGKSVRLKIPPLTQNGQKFRLRGHGMRAGKTSEVGDLYARVEVQLPTQLSAEERTHYEALAKSNAGAAKHSAA
jgi:DnaJ-class molecular chaperone